MSVAPEHMQKKTPAEQLEALVAKFETANKTATDNPGKVLRDLIASPPNSALSDHLPTLRFILIDEGSFSDEQLEILIEFVDKDKDGFIEYDEFLSAFNTKGSPSADFGNKR